MQSAIAKVPDVAKLEIVMESRQAQFLFDPAKTPLQDVVKAVRGAGRSFDAKVLLQQPRDTSKEQNEKLSDELYKVKGVKSAGAPDESGLRQVTLDLEQKTYLKDLLDAGSKAGVKLSVPEQKKR